MSYSSRLKEFDALYAEALRYCQVVEHDATMILALLQEGDSQKNLQAIRKQRMTLGEVLHDISEIDKSSPKPFFSKSDYHVLYSIRDERNHFVHESYAAFLYKTGNLAEQSFEEEFARLSKFHDNMALMAKATQRARIEAAKRKFSD